MLRRLAVLTALLTFGVVGSAAAAAGPISPRIVAGDPVQQAGDYPWQVGLTAYNGGGQYCGGTLIASKYVLTAEHCEPTTSEFVHIGSLGRHSGGEYIQIAAVRKHPRTDNSGDVPRYDANILELAHPVSAQYDHPLAIADPVADTGLWAVGKALTVTGWGDTTDGGSPSSTLLVAQVPRVSDATCGSKYGSNFSSADMVCAGGGATDTCQGDSGGPLAAPAVGSPDITDPADWRLVGVTSWGAACATATVPGVYTRISTAEMWTWADTTPAVPGTATLTGTPAVGQTLTCATTGWTGGRSYRRWRFARNGAAGAVQFGATTTVTGADQGKTITCAAVGDNGAGQTVTAASNALAVPAAAASPDPTPPAPGPLSAEAIAGLNAAVQAQTATTPTTPVVPAPVATPASTPAVAPRTTTPASVAVTRACKQRKCTFTLTSSATALKVTLKRGKATATIYKARRGKDGTFTVKTGKLRKGKYVATVTGAAKPKTLSFTL